MTVKWVSVDGATGLVTVTVREASVCLVTVKVTAVSYTHLDVYKRQEHDYGKPHACSTFLNSISFFSITIKTNRIIPTNKG